MTTSGGLIQELEALSAEAQASIDDVHTPEALEALRVKYLGRKSRLMGVLKGLKTLEGSERRDVGLCANLLKTRLGEQLSQRREALQQTAKTKNLDVTLPGAKLPQGKLHPLTRMVGDLLQVFVPLGFEIVQGPELEFEYYNFDGLNIPSEHPSRDSLDTFFVDLPSPQPRKGRLLLRSHTSPVQIRIMEKRKPPLRIVVPGRVYRRDTLDPGHSFMFHQIEGLVVDDRTHFADLKGTLNVFLQSVFGPQTRTRFRAHYFPFTEPSAEVDIACTPCGGKGCSTCGRKGWIEVLGCGMVHPNVLKGVGYDPKKVQGFAFGLGVERLTMLRHGIKDIRLFFENDVRFLEQF